ncbi:hypothetical protein ACV7JQ_05660 [Globicatella sulfidifaciens]|nr:hypothetical protein [Globicatella sulfidifaciens]MDT2767534.1 hypothetical protein [Globicatella sulfidifaciens]
MKKWKEINLVDDPNTLKKLSRYSYCIRYYIASDYRHYASFLPV